MLRNIVKDLLNCLRNAPIVTSRLGECYELRNQLLTINEDTISQLLKSTLIEDSELQLERKAFISGMPSLSKREAKWQHNTSAEQTYGHYLYTLKRLENAVNILIKDENSRSAQIQIDYLPGRQPCATTFNLSIRDKQLLSTITFRSLDIIAGYPYDAILFWNHFHLSALDMLRSASKNISTGNMSFFVSSLHLYCADNISI